MSALGKVVRAGVGRRRIQTLVMVLTTAMSVAASVLAGGIIVAAHGPFDRAFAKQHGAHLTAQFDSSRVTAAQLAATAHVAGVTAVAGPFPVSTIRPRAGANRSGIPTGADLGPLTVVGRSDSGGPVDDLRITAGVWGTGPGQIVLDDTGRFVVGDRMTFPGLPGKPELVVVGLARSVAHSADGWVSPAQLAALTEAAAPASSSSSSPSSPSSPSSAPSSPPTTSATASPPAAASEVQLLYRFAAAGTEDQIAADRAALAAAVPQGSMTGAASYLTVKTAKDKATATYVPFVVAFGVLGLGMSMLIIGVVVSGAVGAATRRIGILKALGFTPAQVARAYVGQALIPATVGAVLGVLGGGIAALPILNQEAGAFDVGTQTIPPWIDLAAPALALLAVVGTALPSALRAGRLRTVEALAVGRTPKAGGGQRIRAAIGRLPLPRALTLGLGQPLARPGRSATTAAAVVLGTVGVTFGVGLALSINGVSDGMAKSRGVGAVQVQDIVWQSDSGPARRQAVDPAELASKISAQPGTRRYFSTSETRAEVAGLAGATKVVLYQGDSSWGQLQIVAGRWFRSPGEAVVPSGFLHATGTHLGDTITLTAGGHRAPVRLVGEVFTLDDGGMVIFTDSASVTGLAAPAPLTSYQFDIDLKPGVTAGEYQRKLNEVLPDGMSAWPAIDRLNPTLLTMDGLAAMLTLMLVAVAALGVLNTVLLDTRERVHDFGVYKALGMAPRQTAAMMLTSVAAIGGLAGLVGVPLGILLHHQVIPVMGHAAGTRMPAVDVAVFGLPIVAPLLVGGLVIAVAGAALPAGWAARARTATALRTE